jgi:signal transduction histidine kinase
MILRNLVHNALKYTETGSVTVTVEPNARAQRVVFTVSDTGPGIPQADQTAIFEMFRQSENVPQRGDGVGLGLYIVKRLTEALGGQVALESTEGAGSRFIVSLPTEIPYASRA